MRRCRCKGEQQHMSPIEQTRRVAKFGTVGFAALALICAAFAAFVMSKLMASHGLSQEKKLPVVLTTRDISAGESLTRDALRIAIFPESNIPAGAMRAI